jgi:hypothetical protein
MSEGNYSIELITPDLAKAWLADYNTHNIPLDERLVGSYAADMAAGRWRETGDAIRRAKDGTILDGQKRLAAIVASGVTLEMLVVSGLSMESQEVMDTGHKRRLSDVLHLRGEVQAVALATVLRKAYNWEKSPFRTYGSGGGSGAFAVPPTAQMFLAYLDSVPERPGWDEGTPDISRPPGFREAARNGTRIAARLGIPPSTAGLCWWLFERLDHTDNEAFWNALISGADLPSTSAIWRLRKHIEDDRRAVRRDNANLQQAFIMKAWNLWREGQNVGILKIVQGGAAPEPYPEPR